MISVCFWIYYCNAWLRNSAAQVVMQSETLPEGILQPFMWTWRSLENIWKFLKQTGLLQRIMYYNQMYFFPQRAEWNPDTCSFNLSPCYMAADNALQVAVAAGECTHLIFLLSQTKSTSKHTATRVLLPRQHAHVYDRAWAGCCKVGFKCHV